MYLTILSIRHQKYLKFDLKILFLFAFQPTPDEQFSSTTTDETSLKNFNNNSPNLSQDLGSSEVDMAVRLFAICFPSHVVITSYCLIMKF